MEENNMFKFDFEKMYKRMGFVADFGYTSEIEAIDEVKAVIKTAAESDNEEANDWAMNDWYDSYYTQLVDFAENKALDKIYFGNEPDTMDIFYTKDVNKVFEYINSYSDLSSAEIKLELGMDFKDDIKDININAENFVELREKFDGKCNFISELTDEQILDIVDTSGDYEYDEVNGLISEVESRSGIEQPEYDSEDGNVNSIVQAIENHAKFEAWYDEAIKKLRKSE